MTRLFVHNIAIEKGNKYGRTNLDASNGLYNGSPAQVHAFESKNGKVETVDLKVERETVKKMWMEKHCK